MSEYRNPKDPPMLVVLLFFAGFVLLAMFARHLGDEHRKNIIHSHRMEMEARNLLD